jgi:hypothetical protein
MGSRRVPSKRFRVDRLENAIQKGFAQPAGAFNNHQVLEGFRRVSLLVALWRSDVQPARANLLRHGRVDYDYLR